MNARFYLLAALLCLVVMPGCATKNRVKVTEMETRVQELERRLADSEKTRQGLRNALDKLQAEARRAKQQQGQESDELVDAQRRLAESLRKELGDARAELAMTERGLVLTLLNEIFFDSGKAVIKPEGYETLNKVGQVLKESVPDSPVAVEGHTDNDPIKYSSWLSNWELSSGRALAVLHYFIEQQGVPPERLSAVAVGEFHPVSSNDSAEGKRQNRRVEIVILPSQLKKIKE